MSVGLAPMAQRLSDTLYDSLSPTLAELVFQDRQLCPALHRVGRDASAKADAIFRYAESVAPEGVTLGERASEDPVLWYSRALPSHHSSFRHVSVAIEKTALEFKNHSYFK